MTLPLVQSLYQRLEEMITRRTTTTDPNGFHHWERELYDTQVGSKETHIYVKGWGAPDCLLYGIDVYEGGPLATNKRSENRAMFSLLLNKQERAWEVVDFAEGGHQFSRRADLVRRVFVALYRARIDNGKPMSTCQIKLDI